MSETAVVTLLFCDLVGSTELLRSLGDDANDEVRRSLLGALGREANNHGGTVVKTAGDGMMVSFQTSAADAVACAIAIQRAASEVERNGVPLGLELRVGISSGEASHEDGDWFGTPVVEAARLESAAQAGQILVSEVVRSLVGTRGGAQFRSAGTRELKGFARPVPVVEVVWRDATTPRPVKLWANMAFRIVAAVLGLGVVGGGVAGGLVLSGTVGGSGSPARAEYRELDYRLVNGTGSFQIVSGDCQSSDLIFGGTSSNDVSGDISGDMTFSLVEGILYVSDRCQWGDTPGTFTITDQGGNTLSGVSDFPLHYATSPSPEGPAVQDPAAPMAFIYTGGTGIYEGATGRARCLGPVAFAAHGGSNTADSAYEKDCTGQVALGAAAAGVGPVILEMAAGVVKMAVFASPVALPKKAYFAVPYMNTRNEPQTGLSLKLSAPEGVEMRAATRDEKDPAAGERVWALPDMAPREVGRFVFSVTFLSAETKTVNLVAEIDSEGFDQPVRSDPLEIEVVQ